MLNKKDIDTFKEQGYVIAPNCFDAKEVALLQQAIEYYHAMHQKAIWLKDSAGNSVSLALWNEPGDDIFGAVSRCERIVNSMEQLLGGEVYHYHSKLTAKPPRTQGVWDWHQDYGYWYDNGLLFPRAASVMLAVSQSVKANGCLQVIPGSHHMGRLKHHTSGEQAGADPQRVSEILKRYPPVYVELQPGDVVFFHCNTLHCSSHNSSDEIRNTLISSYNRADNSAYREHQHPNYTPLKKISDSAIKGMRVDKLDTERAFFPHPSDVE